MAGERLKLIVQVVKNF